jgi:HAD superfamily hydrolase (TIGR01509 family)
MISAIVFDFDGVLCDSEPLHLRAYQQVLAPLGGMLSADEYCTKYLGFDDDGVFRVFAADRGWSVSDDQIADLIARKSQVVDAMLTTGEVLYPGASACVERMAASFQLGIASGSYEHEIDGILVRANLRRHFRFIVGAGDTARGKPAPDPYALAARRHERPPQECVAVEDSRWGIESAKVAGLRCIGITHTYPRSELSQADLVIDRLDELTPALVRGLAP